MVTISTNLRSMPNASKKIITSERSAIESYRPRSEQRFSTKWANEPGIVILLSIVNRPASMTPTLIDGSSDSLSRVYEN